MRRVLVVAFAAAICLGCLATSAAAAPKSNGNGNAYAYGLTKNVDNNGQSKKIEVTPPPQSTGPTEGSNWEYVTVYNGPLNIDPRGLIIPMFKEVKTGDLGYVRPNWSLTCVRFGYLGQIALLYYWPVFDMEPGNTLLGCSWADPQHRITYAVEQMTTVSAHGSTYRLGSPEAQAELSDPTHAWKCTYREKYDLNSPNGIGVNGWFVLDYSVVE